MPNIGRPFNFTALCPIDLICLLAGITFVNIADVIYEKAAGLNKS